MMRQPAGAQAPLFYAFNLESHVPQDHLLRGIDRFLDLSELRQHLTDYYSHTGRPSIAPELMIRMLVIGYCFGIRSERRPCKRNRSTTECHVRERLPVTSRTHRHCLSGHVLTSTPDIHHIPLLSFD